MRLMLLMPLAMIGLAGCVNTAPTPEAVTPAVVAAPPTTYVTPGPAVVPAPGATVITR